MYNILALTDFNYSSSRGLFFSEILSTRIKGKINVLGINKLDKKRKGGKIREPNKSEKAFIHQHIAGSGISIDVIDTDDTLDAITPFLSGNKTDLIVIGCASGKKSTLLIQSDKISNLLKKLSQPILFVSKPIDLENFNDITFYFPMISEEDYPKSLLIHDLALGFGAKVHLLTVVDPHRSSNFNVINKLGSMAIKYNLENFSINTTYNTLS